MSDISADFIFQVVPNGAAYDVVDTRTKPNTVVTPGVTLAAAQADAVARNRTVAGLP